MVVGYGWRGWFVWFSGREDCPRPVSSLCVCQYAEAPPCLISSIDSLLLYLLLKNHTSFYSIFLKVITYSFATAKTVNLTTLLRSEREWFYNTDAKNFTFTKSTKLSISYRNTTIRRRDLECFPIKEIIIDVEYYQSSQQKYNGSLSNM